jgi:hypothetical protein
MPRTSRSSDFLEEIHLLRDRIRRLELRPQSNASKVIIYSVSGNLTIHDGKLRWYPLAGSTLVLIHASVGTAPSGGGCTVRVKVNGTTVDSVTISAGSNQHTSKPNKDLEKGDYLTIDVTASNNATDLVVELKLR